MTYLLRMAGCLLLGSAGIFGLSVLEVLTGWLPMSAGVLYGISQHLLWYAYGLTALALVLAVRR